jgi:hypothetical protein
VVEVVAAAVVVVVAGGVVVVVASGVVVAWVKGARVCPLLVWVWVAGGMAALVGVAGGMTSVVACSVSHVEEREALCLGEFCSRGRGRVAVACACQVAAGAC